MRTCIRATALLAAFLALPCKLAGQAIIKGGADLGIRSFITNPRTEEQAKFLQYRDVPAGWLLESLFLQAAQPDNYKFLQVFGYHLGQQDQNLSVRANIPGTADIQLKWDRTPHVFSTNSRFLAIESSPGVFTLPKPRPDTASLNRSAYVRAVKTQWDPMKLSFGYAPSRDLDFKAEFRHIDKNGYRPMGMVFGSPGTVAYEINEPIDQGMNDFRLTQAYRRAGMQVMLSYAYSSFSNAFVSVTANHPFNTTDSLRAGTSRGLSALPPSNHAQNIAGTASFKLPLHTRASASLAYGWRYQNANFPLPTINTMDFDSIVRAGYRFPGSLDGKARTSMMNLALNSRPVRPITISGRYRTYAFEDNTPHLTLPVKVSADRSFATPAIPERFPYDRDNADVNVILHAPLAMTVTGSYAWERMDRDTAVRNVGRVIENTNRVAVDFNGISWATLRVSYGQGERRGNGYKQLTSSENIDARRFDQSDRNRRRLTLMAAASPFDELTLSGTYELGRDTFPNSKYGVQKDNSNLIGGDIDYMAFKRVSLSAGYARESYDNQFQERYRTGNTPATTDNPTYNWIATNIDSTSTAYASVNATVMPDRVVVGGLWQMSKSRFQMRAYNPLTPTGGTAAQNQGAVAMDFPVATHRLTALSVHVTCQFSADWSFTSRYEREKFSNYDFRTSDLRPATGNQIFQGNDLLPYQAEYFTFVLSYRPNLLRKPRPAS
jgi:hypothetical protein